MCIVVYGQWLIHARAFTRIREIKRYDVVNISNMILYVTRKEFVPDSVLVENKS